MPAYKTKAFFNSNGATFENIKLGLAWLISCALKTSAKIGLLAVPAKTTFDNLEKFLGKQFVSAIKKNNSISLHGVTIELLTEKIPKYTYSGPILALYPTQNLLNILDALEGEKDILVLPWLFAKIQDWVQTWSANEYGQTAIVATISLPPLVEKAMQGLCCMINKSTGITHPSDRSATIHLFVMLHKARVELDLVAIRRWLVAVAKLKPSDADEIQEIAKKVLEGKRLRYETGQWKANIIDIWQSELAVKNKS